jgi:SAM-dependent methyltransferase
MKRSQVLEIHDDAYAATYDERFHSNENRTRSDHEIEIISTLLTPGGEWLDAGCGTGYVLGHFPGVPRAGIDLAPAMLKRAALANPDALFLLETNFLNDVPEWHGRWSLVTCMWYAYCLLESISEVERLISNLAHWTSDAGACFVPLCDPNQLAAGVRIPYRNEEPFYGGAVMITGATWAWIDGLGVKHENMIAPHVEHMVSMFGEHFDVVDVIEYPLSERGPRRKAIVARSKKSPRVNGQPTTERHCSRAS